MTTSPENGFLSGRARDPDGIASRADFARELTALRLGAGLTVRDVAEAVGIQSSTAGGYFGGRHLPALKPPTVILEILRACGVSDKGEAERWLAALERVRRTPGPRPAGSPVPYRGLASYRPQDHDWFFGREAMTAQLIGMVRRQVDDGGPLVVVGPSGSGKSSLLQAGLLASMARGEFSPESGGWPRVLFTPGDRPLQEFAVHLGRAAGLSDDEARGLPETGEDWLARLIDLVFAVPNGPDGSTDTGRALVLVVDQFEEVFSSQVSEAQRQSFLDALLSAGRYEPHRVLVILAMRADFYAHATRYPDLVPALQESQIVVGPMTQHDLRRVIVEPANKARVDIGEGLVELILRDLAPTDPANTYGHDPGTLPLLSHALLTTWKRGNERALTVAEYQEGGGIRDAIARSAEEIFLDLGADEQDVARSMFLRLVHIDDDAADTRRRVAPAELTGGAAEPNPVAVRVLRRFTDARLITSDTDTIAITHEALLHAWPRLRAWLDEDRDGLRVYRQLTDAARDWNDSGRDPESLLRGSRLDNARTWNTASHHRKDLNTLEREFLDLSVQHELDEHRARHLRTRRLYQLVSALTVMLLFAAAATGFAFQQRASAKSATQAAEAARDAAISRQVAGEANQLASSDPALADQLALAGYQEAVTPEARSALYAAAAGPMVTRIKASAATMAVAIAGDGRLMAVGDSDGRVRLWNLRNLARPVALGPPMPAGSAALFGAAISPDSRLLAVGGAGSALHLWDISQPKRPIPLPAAPGVTSTVYAVAFSPDGSILAAGTDQQSVLLWDVRDPRHLRLLNSSPHGRPSAVHALAFRPTGRILAAAGEGNHVQLWNVSTAMPVAAGASLDGPTGVIFAMAFSPDGKTLAVGSADRSVYLWDLSRSQTPQPDGRPLGGFNGYVNAVAFSADGRLLVVASADATVRIWRLADERLLAQLPHPGPVTEVDALPSNALLTGDADGYARIWRLPGANIPAPNLVFTVEFKPTGHTLAVTSESTGSTVGAIDLWNVSDMQNPVPAGPAIASPRGPAAFCGSSALSPDGRILAIGSVDGSTQLWNVTDPAHNHPVGTPLRGPTQQLETLAFSPDGRTLAVGSDDHTVWMWNISDPSRPEKIATLSDATNFVFGLAFDPTGRLLAVGSADRKTYLYSVGGQEPPHLLHVLSGPTDYVYSVAFSLKGHLLAAGSADKTVTLWDVASPTNPRLVGKPLTGPNNYIYSVAFSPDGAMLAAGSTDHSVWLWNVSQPQSPQVTATLQAPAGVFTIAFSPDGQTIAAGTADSTVRLWQINPQRAEATICRTHGDPITPAEWQQYLPGVPYRLPCGETIGQ